MHSPITAMPDLANKDIGALVALLDAGSLGDAESRCRTLLDLHPASGILWKILSVAQLRQGKDALAALQKAAELSPQDAEAHSNLGSAYHERGRWADALVSLRHALRLRPDDVAALVDAADSLKALGELADAITLYQQALRLDRRQPDALNNLGNALMQIGRQREAASAYRFALDLKPDSAPLQFNLANAHRQLGNFEEAISASRRAIALDAGLALAHNNLGLALVGSGRAAEAIASFRQALALGAMSVEVLNNLGTALCDVGEFREAVDVYRRVVDLDPAGAEGHCNLADALFQAGPAEEAAVHYRQAVALQPGLARGHLGLAMALRAQRRAVEAEASCLAALAIDADSVEAICLLGELAADRGRFGEAEDSFRRAMAVKPDFPAAYVSFAAHRRMSRDEVSWLKGVQSLLSRPLTLGNEINLRYALGKYFDDTGQFDAAFPQFRQANELTRRYGFRYDSAKLVALVDDIISRLEANAVRDGIDGASESELPVFIIGMPRSGTSLTEQILASHPAALGAGELRFWDTAFSAAKSNGLAGTEGASFVRCLAGDYLARLTAARTGTQSRVIDKLPANFLYAGLIHLVFPRARIIHVSRNPIDTCLSIYFQNYSNMIPYANDLDDLAHFYLQYARIMDHWRRVLPSAVLLELPYEALIEDQEGSTRRMLDFAGLPWDAKCLAFQDTDRIVITASKWQVRQKLYTASAGRWRNYEKHIGPLRSLESHAIVPLDRAVSCT